MYQVPMKWLRKSKPEPAYRLGTLAIGEPWARLGYVPETGEDEPRIGGYFTLANAGSEADRLLGASCADAEAVEVQAIKVVGAGIAMRALDAGLVVPPDTTLTLQPRGYHLSFKVPEATVSPGMRLAATLHFQRSGDVKIELPVRDVGPVGNWAMITRKPHTPSYRLGGLEIGEPWARLGAAPERGDDQPRLGGYFILCNMGSTQDRLLRASSSAAGGVEIQGVKNVGPSKVMRLLPQGIALPPGIAYTLMPDSYHLSFRDHGSDLSLGRQVPVTLSFEHAGDLAIELPVRDVGPVGNWALAARTQPR